MKTGRVTRRAFVKTALGGAAGALTAGIGPGTQAAMPVAASVKSAANETELWRLSLADASEMVRNKKVSPVELTRACLARIEQLNAKFNAFITVTAELALADAKRAEEDVSHKKWRGPMHGIPVALKDLVDTAGVRTTAGSGVFKDRVPTEDAEVVRRLKTAGAVLLGKLNMHEFAYGGSTVISYFGPVKNPWNVDYCVGGSSAGSAAAVAAGLCYGAIGSDTGGSIRQPAGYAGIVGLKPTYGRVSTRGAVPLSWTLDHLGPMTRTVRDTALMLDAIAGYDAEETTSVDVSVERYAANIAGATNSLRLGIPSAYFFDGLHGEVQAAMETALEVLKKLTASQRELGPMAGDAAYALLLDPQSVVQRAEAFAYHREMVTKTPELYHPETLKRIQGGADITAPAYIAARERLAQIRRHAGRIFDGVDILVTPTSPVPPYRIGDLLAEMSTLRRKEIQMLHNTRPFDGFGLPTVSVPIGFTKDGLPIGMQITGPPWGEATVLRLAHAYEQATEWQKKRPEDGLR